MSVFDVAFLALALAGVVTLLTSAWYVLRKDYGRARRILGRLLLCVSAYFCVVIGVSAVLPRRALKVGEVQCFDDWCIDVDGFRTVAEKEGTNYIVDLRLSSRARRIFQREKNLSVYLTDDQGRRHDAVAGKSVGQFDALLGPGESVKVSRSFQVPSGSNHVGVVIAHEGGFPIGWLIIGYDTWFRKPPVVWLH